MIEAEKTKEIPKQLFNNNNNEIISSINENISKANKNINNNINPIFI